MRQMTENQSQSDLVLSEISKGVRVMVDDHVTYRVEEEEIQGYALLSNGHISPLVTTARYFSLNALYFDEIDNKIHLSRSSVGGVINLMESPDIHHAIKRYNETAAFVKIEEYVIFAEQE